MAEALSTVATDWYANGQRSYREGFPRVAAPSAQGPGKTWCEGWDAAAAADEAKEETVINMAIRPVQIQLIGGKLVLTDMDGNRIGDQWNVTIEQPIDDRSATIVTFIDVPIVSG